MYFVQIKQEITTDPIISFELRAIIIAALVSFTYLLRILVMFKNDKFTEKLALCQKKTKFLEANL